MKEANIPIVQIHIVEGRPREKVRAMLREVAAAVSSTLDAPIETVRVVVTQHPPENWGVGLATKAEMDAVAKQEKSQ